MESVGDRLQFGPVAFLEHASGGDGFGALDGIRGFLRVPAGLHPVLADADPVRAQPDAGEQQDEGAADRQPGAERDAGEEGSGDGDHGFASGVITVPAGVAVAVAESPGRISIASPGGAFAAVTVCAVAASLSIVSACFFAAELLPK